MTKAQKAVGKKQQEYLVVAVLQRIAGRNNLWDEIHKLYLFLVKSLVRWEYVVGLLSSSTATF